MEDGKPVDGSYWFYAPNKGAPVFFTVAFAASGIFHFWQCVHYKSWRLTGLYFFCATLFTAGFIAREMGAFKYDDLIIYIVSICLVYAAPPLFELCNYNVLGRILYYVPYHAPLHPGRVITTFGFISFVIEGLNGTGASYTANQSLTNDQQEIGRNLLKAALLLQVFVVGTFLLLAGIFHHRCIKAGINNPNLRNALYTLYTSSALLTVRTIYRVVEYWSVAELHYGPGFDPASLSPLVRYEWFFYVFEASLMLCNQVLLNLRHPRHFLPKSTKTYLALDGVTEVTGPGYREHRPFFLTIVDPFDILGIIRGRDKQDRFWETHVSDSPGSGSVKPESRGPRDSHDPEAA